MIKLTAITLFPDMFQAFTNEGVVSRAIKSEIVQFESVPLRDFSKDARRNVDEHPAGGGDGMVLRADVAEEALLSVLQPHSQVILTTPRGKPFQHTHAKSFAQEKHLIFLCGRYAGFDERFVQKYVHHHLSLGDFVLSGGELPAMCFMDAICRHIPGVLGNRDSATFDSFEDGLLEAPCYTKPQDFHGETIPEVLTSGNHKKINEYRRKEQLKISALMRPDLVRLKWNELTSQEKTLVEKIWKDC